MTNVKKQFEEVYALLEANSNKKVSTLMPQLIELMSRKGGGMANGKNFLKDDEGKVIAVFCYYHKKWEAVSEVEYGAKKGTATGLNTMCKEGVSAWTKQQRRKKADEAKVLDLVAKGELEPADIGAKLLEIKDACEAIEPRDDEHGFDSVEELMDAIAEA